MSHFYILVNWAVTRMEFIFADGKCLQVLGHLSEGQGLELQAELVWEIRLSLY